MTTESDSAIDRLTRDHLQARLRLAAGDPEPRRSDETQRALHEVNAARSAFGLPPLTVTT